MVGPATNAEAGHRARRGVALAGLRAAFKLGLSLATACAPASHDHDPRAVVPPAAITVVRGTPVATIDGESITAEEIAAAAREANLDDPRAALERAIQDRLLAREATRRGLDNDPLVLDTARRAMVQALLARSVEQSVRPETLPADELAAGMRIRGFDLRHGELKQTEHTLVTVAAGADAATRERARALAEAFAVRARELALPRSGAPFQALADQVFGAAAHRVEALPPFDADGHFGRGEMVRPFVEATARLTTPGELSPVVETEFGFHVIVLVGLVPALEAPLEEVQGAIRNELLWRHRHRALETFLDQLRTRYNATVQDEALRVSEQLRVEGTPP